MSDIVFRRIGGRIIPIKKKIGEIKDANTVINKTSKKDIPAIAMIGAGFGVSAGSGYYGGKMIRQSWQSYRKSAHIRGSIKEMASIVPAKTLGQFYKDASAFKIAGKALSKRGFGLLATGTLVGSSIAGYGAYKYLDKKTNSANTYSFASTIAAVASGAGLALFARKAKIKHIVQALKISGKTNISDMSTAWGNMGKARTRETINKYAKMAQAGVIKDTKTKNTLATINQLRKASRQINKTDPNQMKLF